jgi:SSS family solute:Na+ symporter
MQINVIDFLIIILSVIIIVWWGLKNSNNSSLNGYFLAGKSQSWWMVAMSLFGASVSTTTLIGNSSEGFISGFAVFNYNLSAVFVIVFVCLFFLPFYIRSGIYTIPEYLGRRFDNRSRKYFSFITIIGNVFLDAAAALYTGGLLISIIFPGIPLYYVIVMIALLAGLYTVVGGLSSVINAEVIQSFVLIIGSVLLTFFCFEAIGGWNEFILKFKDGVWLNLVRPIDDKTMPWPALLLSLPILGIYFWGNNQMIVQRVLSAKSVNEGRIGFIFVAFLYLFTLFLFVAPGLIGRALNIFDLKESLPLQIFDGVYLREQWGIETNQIYPKLIIELMPVGFVGIILAAMISALTSTLSATLNSASTLFTMDFYKEWQPNASAKKLIRVGQIASFVALVIAVCWAPLISKFSSLVSYYQEFSAYLAPPIVGTFLLGLFWKRSTKEGAFGALISGLILAMCIMGLKFILGFEPPFHFLFWSPILLIISSLLNVIISLRFPRTDEDVISLYTWSKKIWRQDTEELKYIPIYKNFRIWSLIVFILGLLMYLYFNFN